MGDATMKLMRCKSDRIVCILLALVVGGCGGDGSPTPSPAPTPAPNPAPLPTPSPSPPNPASPMPGTGAGAIEFLHVFGIDEMDGAQPNGPLVLASDGNLYGTTKQGGGKCADTSASTESCGVVFRATPGGVVSVVHRFQGSPNDGKTPFSGLVQGRDGALYGTTVIGGKAGRGVAFRLTLGGDYKVLHHFDEVPGSGDRPTGSLVQAGDGNFYGTTLGGGPHSCSAGGCGTIFRLTTNGDYQVIYNFGDQPGDGALPNGSLIVGNDGALYGTALVGGDARCSDPSLSPRVSGCGTIFRITTSGEMTILHAFGPDLIGGINPSGGILRGPDGAFYGTARGGGTGQCINSFGGCGTVFRITSAGAFNVVYEFSKPSTRLPGETLPGSDGFTPIQNLWLGRDGLFYGGTYSGGVTTSSDTGTLFSLTPAGAKTILYRFGPSNEYPAVPVGGLLEGAEGVFWGVTEHNGTLGRSGARTGSGTLFRIAVPRRP